MGRSKRRYTYQTEVTGKVVKKYRIEKKTVDGKERKGKKSRGEYRNIKRKCMK